MSKHGNKELQTINLNSDARELLKEQANEAGISISTYIERLILEKHNVKEYKKSRKRK